MQKYKIILYYNYTFIDDPEQLMQQQKGICEKLDLKGRLIIAKEGINGTFEGTEENIDKYVEDLKSDKRFNDNYNTQPSEIINLSFTMDYLGFFGYEQRSNVFFEETGDFNYGY